MTVEKYNEANELNFKIDILKRNIMNIDNILTIEKQFKTYSFINIVNAQRKLTLTKDHLETIRKFFEVELKELIKEFDEI